jgi:hypothetical protein
MKGCNEILVLLVEGLYEVSRLDGFMWYDILEKIREDWHRPSRNIKGFLL